MDGELPEPTPVAEDEAVAEKVPIKTLPNLRDIIDGRVQVNQIRALSLEDLMARQPVALDAGPLRRLVNGRRHLFARGQPRRGQIE